MISVVRNLLQKIIDDIDAGNTNISEKDEIKIIESLRELRRKDKPMSKYQAYTYLEISRATFDNMIREGKLPEGKHIAGFKEKFWDKSEIDKYLKRNKVDG